MNYNKGTDSILLNGIGYVFMGIFAVAALFPFILLISGSVTGEKEIVMYGYSLLPRNFNLDAYTTIFQVPTLILNAYKVTFFITIVGTLTSLFIISMTAYVLSRKDFPYRNVLSFFFYFTTLFSGGLVSYYIIMVSYLHMKDNILALILPGILNVMYLLMMRNFITTMVPESLIESAKIDGAGDFKVYRSIVLPLLTPALASIGLFIVLGYWNDWWHAMLFINKENMLPLQYVLYRILTSAANISEEAAKAGVVRLNLPKESLKLALTVVVTGPIILAYPFVQRFFVSGITMGAVKG